MAIPTVTAQKITSYVRSDLEKMLSTLPQQGSDVTFDPIAVEKALKKDDEDTDREGKLAFSKEEVAKFAADRKRDAKFRTSKADDSVMNKK